VSSNFLYSTVGRNSDNYFPRKAYVALLRKHLGGGLTNDEQESDRLCQCGQLNVKAHSLSCSLNSDKRNKKHNSICELLHRFMKAVNPGDRIEREEEVGQITTPNERGGPDKVTHVQADIVWQNGTDKLVVDVHVMQKQRNILSTQIVPTKSRMQQHWLEKQEREGIMAKSQCLIEFQPPQ